MSINNLRLAARLWGGFGAVLTIMVAIALISTVSFSRIRTDVQDAQTMRLPAALAADRLAFDTLKIHQLMAQAAAAFSKDGMKAADSTLVDIKAQLQTLRQIYQKEGRAEQLKTVDALEAAYAKFLADGKNMVEVYTSQGGIDAAGKELDAFDRDSRALAERVLGLQKDQVDAAGARIQGIEATLGTVQWTMLVLTTLAAAGGCLIAYFITLSVTRPLKQAVAIANQIASGDLTSQQGEEQARDEIGQLLAALRRMQMQLRETIAEIVGQVGQLSASSNKLSADADQVAALSSQQSDASASMAATIEEMMASIDHLSARARETLSAASLSGEKAQQGAEIVKKSASEIRTISDLVLESSQVISHLGDESNRISAIVNVIKEIADQTNLLALNAAIEAARAGDQGRGFAVVADEVRKLAERTTHSTKEIAGMINAVVEGSRRAVESMQRGETGVQRGVTLASQAGEAIEAITKGSAHVVQAVNDITAALQEQSASSGAIANNVEKIAQMADQNSAFVHKTSEASQELDELAASLSRSVARFKTG